MKNIPNIITCLNLLAGCMACVMALRFDNFVGAFIFIVIAALFDFLDGFFARLLKAYSDIGAELDSLADIVSFGLAPSCVIYVYLSQISVGTPYALGLPFFAFLIAIFSGIRLAKFNVDTRQTTSFLGLPVPANGLFWTSFIPAILPYSQMNPIISIVIITILIVIFSLLMTSEIPMFSLKFKSYTWKGNEWSYSLILLSILIIALSSIAGTFLLGVSLIIIAYIVMSLIKNIVETKSSEKDLC